MTTSPRADIGASVASVLSTAAAGSISQIARGVSSLLDELLDARGTDAAFVDERLHPVGIRSDATTSDRRAQSRDDMFAPIGRAPPSDLHRHLLPHTDAPTIAASAA